MPADFDAVVTDLRAIAEPSRLRLLAILVRGEFSVNELTEILGQSQPRVSRHLKLLCDAGLLERFREQHWIYYRVPADGEGRAFVAQVLARLESHDAVLAADAARVAAVIEARQVATPHDEPKAPGEADARPGELAMTLIDELGDHARGAVFYYGPGLVDVLGSIATRARRVVGMHRSRVDVQRARAVLHTRGLSHCVLQQGEIKSLPHAAAGFDTVIVDRSLLAAPRPADALREFARLLVTKGELVVVEDYDRLEGWDDVADNALVLLRSWLADAGLACRRLHPIDIAGQHVVIAVARREIPASAAA